VNDFPLQNAVELCPLERHSETRVNHIDVSAMHESLRRAAHNGETGVVQRIPALPSIKRQSRRKVDVVADRPGLPRVSPFRTGHGRLWRGIRAIFMGATRSP
jgi:hypothetical protein